jgi:hypothetical protein
MAQTLKFGKGTWATKTGSSMAYNDQNGNYKPLPFNVERDSIATRVNKEGLIEVVGKDKLRIDYTDSAKGVALLEPSRTNSLLQSNQFDTTWTTSSATVTNEQIGVGGSTDAWELEKTATNGYIRHIGISVVNGSVSIYAKKGNSNWLRLGTSSGNIEAYFDLENGIIGNKGNLVDDVNITDMSDGWYRCSFSYTGTATGVYLYPADNNGDTSETSGSIYIQYAQIEEGSYATSYIPTQGSAVTRLADVCNNGGNDQVINSTEGVLYAEISALADDITNRVISLSNGTNNNIISVQFSNVQSNDIIAYYNATGQTGRVISTTSYNIKSFNKIALVWNNSSFKFYVNGYLIGSATIETPLVYGTLNQLKFQYGNSTLSFYGNVKDVRVYDSALTDQEAIALTQV